METPPPWFHITYFSSTLLIFICHVIGLIILWRVKSPAVNQRIIIINLAASEMLFCANQLVYYASKDIFDQPTITLVKVNQPLRFIVYTANKLVMIHLILDRFADIYLNIKYALYFTQEKVIKILASIWIMCVVYGVTLGVLMEVFTKDREYPKFQYLVNIVVSIVLDALITFLAVGTFSYFLYKVRKIMTRDNLSNGNNMQNRKSYSKQKFLVPFLMIATYVAFNVTGTWLVTLYGIDPVLYYVAWLMVGFGYLTDAILYVFLQKDNRIVFSKLISCQERSLTIHPC